MSNSMASRFSTHTLARASARHPWWVVAAWVATVVVAVGLIVTLLGDSLTTEGEATRTIESDEVWELLDERFRGDQVQDPSLVEVLLIRSEALTVDDPAFQRFVEGGFEQLTALGPEVVASATSFYESGDASLVSADRHTAYVVFTLPGPEAIDPFFASARTALLGSSDFETRALRATNPAFDQEIVIIRGRELTVDDDAFRAFVDDLFLDLSRLRSEFFIQGTTYYLSGEEGLVSEDRPTMLIPLNIDEDEVQRIIDLVEEGRADGRFDLFITGTATLDLEFEEAAERDLFRGEFQFGLPIAVLVLLVVFGAVVAAALPLILALIAIMIALGLAALLGLVFDLSIFITNMVFLIGLAVGIDYSLFMLARYREERGAGAAKSDAIALAGGTAGRAVLFSGITVVLALFGMLLVPETTFISLGTGAILVVIVAVLASLTLLPATLSILGDGVNRLGLPFIGGKETGAAREAEGGFWDAVTRAVMRAPALSVLLAGGLLVALSIPAFALNFGSNGVDVLPESFESRAGFEVLQEDFSAGLIEPTIIVVDGDIADPAVRGAIDQLATAMAADGSFGPLSETVNTTGDLARLTTAIAGGSATSSTALDAIKRLRDDYIPAAFDDVPARALVGGATAETLDFETIGRDAIFVVFPFVLGLSFLLLLVVFRSIVVPLKAIVMNLLSVGAAYGLLVLIFQEGIGNEIFGFTQSDVIEAWIPVFLFSVLFGLSMDYHVFLLSRIRERFDETGDNTESVAFGLRSTARLITGAALIMVAVFGGFASGDLVMFEQMGFGLGVAVLIDATIIRSVLVPASMQLLGNANWYFPHWLAWLPRFQIEGASGPRTPAAGEAAGGGSS